MQTSGLVLDVYDDFRGDVLRSIFPSREALPGLVKEAHVLSSDERYLLPDDAFALVLMNDGQKLRKFACIDAGNTALSVRYFEKNAHKLPLHAQLVAASNLAKACGWYGLEELAKEAGLVGWAAQKGVQRAVSHPIDTAMKLQQGSALVQGTKQDMQARMGAIRQMEGPGQIVTPHQVGHALGKMAEMTATPLMPTQSPTVKAVEPTKAVVNKTGSASRSLQPYVDVTNHAPPAVLREKKANLYALGERYPLDSYEQVSRAVGYFDEHGKRFTPAERREYCTNVEKRASELALSVGPALKKYAGQGYAPDEEIKMAMAVRRRCLVEDSSLNVLSLLEEKRAEISPELFCATLEEFDKVAGLDHHYDKNIPDPFYSTYGVEKNAEDDWSWLDGNLYVTKPLLQTLAQVQSVALRKTFGDDFAVEFRKDPVGIFNSLPKDQKRIIANFASDNAPGADLSR